jgi:lipoprotein-anchoring transpeptidase ErfK/SrfK
MKKIPTFFATLTLILACLPFWQARAEGTSQPEDNAGAIVCPPDVYWQPPSDCLPLGPSEYLTEMARLGMTFPLQPLVARTPDYSLNTISYLYYRVNSTGTSFYPSLDAAIAKQGASLSLAPGRTLYVTYLERVDTPRNGTYFLLPSGEWMPGDGSTVSVPVFQGLEFSSTPRNSFGWTFENISVKSAPGYNMPDTGENLAAFTVVQIYNTQTIDSTDWNLIGPDQWVEARKVAQVVIQTKPPEGLNNSRWIDVNLAEQTLAVYENNQLVFATVIATGLEPFWTRPGLFQIYQKKEIETMRNNDPTDFYYLENVPWTMYFDKARALHGAYWRTRFGYPQSHGCVNLSVGDSHWLFNWAKEGDWVYVHDPSGLTPTDPAKYGEGAP